MNNYEWLQWLYNGAKQESWYSQCLRVYQEREAGFLEIRSRLPPQEQEILDLYIAACDELQFTLVHLAADEICHRGAAK